MIKVVGKLGAGSFLARHHFGDQLALQPQLVAQPSQQAGIFGKTLDQDGPCPVKGGLDISHALAGIDKSRCRLLGLLLRPGQQAFCQRFQPGFAGDLRAGTPFGLVGQVQVFQPGLVGRSIECRFQFTGQLALLGNGLEDAVASLVQLAQIAQALVQLAQLGVIQPAGGFLAVAGHKRHGCSAVQQLHGSGHLAGADLEFLGNTLGNRFQHGESGIVRKAGL